MPSRQLNLVLSLMLTAMLGLAADVAVATPPPTINYQGSLANAGGTPVNGSVVMTFRLYNAASGGAMLWQETQLSVGVTNGNFSAALGSATPITLPFDVPYWLTVQINADGEMSPRQPLASSPYAFRASMLDSSATIDGARVTGTIGSGQLATTQRLPAVACALNQIPQWNGSAWSCATGAAGPAGPQGAQGNPGNDGATGPQGPVGPNDVTGNLTLVNSTPFAGNILKGGTLFMHNAGTDNAFLGGAPAT